MLTTENIFHILEACNKKMELAFNTYSLYITSWTSFGHTVSGTVWFMFVEFGFLFFIDSDLICSSTNIDKAESLCKQYVFRSRSVTLSSININKRYSREEEGIVTYVMLDS
jgi:hypothetical protein